MRITAEEYRALVEGKKDSGSKMHNRKVPYRGRTYDSQLEADTAAQLDLLVKAGEILAWKAQESFELPHPSGGKRSRSYHHRVDFLVFVDPYVYCLIECKGHETERGKAKRALLEQRYKVRVEVISKPRQVAAVVRRVSECVRETRG